MKRYEYRSFNFKAKPGKKLDGTACLNEIGNEGWLAVVFEGNTEHSELVIVASREKE
jgi:hypothetical protein